MLPVTEVVVFLASARSPDPEYLLPIGAKWLIGEKQIPERKVMPWQEDVSQKVVNSNPSWQKISYLEILLCNLYIV